MTEIENPFEVRELEEIHLPEAPLIRVIAQVRFPSIVSIEDSKYIAGFQESLRSEYPIVKTEKSLVVNILDPKDKREETIWRFFDKDEVWRLTLAPEFLAIETRKYDSRDDFFSRYQAAINSLSDHIKPNVINRIGVRYIDQITDGPFDNISNLVRSEILGIYKSALSKHISSSLRQTVFTIDEDTKLSARWGVLAKKQTYDPSSVAPIDKDSWMLDLDVFNAKKQDFDRDSVLEESKKLAAYAYNFFRWAVKDDFLTAFGGKLK